MIATGHFTKKKYKIRTKNEGLESTLVLGSSNLHGFLGRFARKCFSRCGLGSRLYRGASEVHKEHRKQRVGEVKHAIWDLRMVSIDVVFEHTTLVPMGKDHLQSLLVIFLHDLLVPARLRMEGRHLVFGFPEL